MATVGWLDGENMYEHPDLAGVTGWHADWGMVTGASIDLSCSALASSLDVLQFLRVTGLVRPEQEQWSSKHTTTVQP
jgi:hypothetical protein